MSKMPGYDKSGPMGAGPMTGGRRGLCNPANTGTGAQFAGSYGYGRGMNFGRGFRGGYGPGRGSGKVFTEVLHGIHRYMGQRIPQIKQTK